MQGEAVTVQFDGVKVFSATKFLERDKLGDVVTSWMNDNPSHKVVRVVVSQSSDNEFHCLTLTVFYQRIQAARKAG